MPSLSRPFAVNPFKNKPRNNAQPDIESQTANSGDSSNEKVESYPADASRRTRSGPFRFFKIGRKNSEQDPEAKAAKRAKWKKWAKWFLWVVGALATLAILAAITYVVLLSSLLERLNPPSSSQGLSSIVDNWKEPDENGTYQYAWRSDFSRDIVTRNCHSHNDYWRRVPLYQALSLGCISVEADIWITPEKDLRVGHTWKSTVPTRTLHSLYIDPLTNILTNRNVTLATNETRDTGIFDTNPSQSVTLFIDMKTDGPSTYPILKQQLQPMMDAGWLTYFNGTDILRGPITVVGSGNTPFSLIQNDTVNRFVFFDAPIMDVNNNKYNTTNSYYASARLPKALGTLIAGRFKKSQIATAKKQIDSAQAKGLLSRYYDTPAWPISVRDRVWFTLTDANIGLLNIDDLVSATKWNWNWCVIGPWRLCGNS